MRILFQLSFLFWVVFVPPSFSAAGEIDDWFEMLDACEAIIVDQQASPFEGLEPAETLVNVDGLDEVAVFHPTSSLVASAASSGGEWFLCIVAATPALELQHAGSLKRAWLGAQNELAQSEQNNLISFDDKTTFTPVRVRCLEKGRLVVAMAFEYENREFRMGVTNRLPSSVENPCLN